jgi:hypothetical protein
MMIVTRNDVSLCQYFIHLVDNVQAGEGAWGTEEADMNAVLCLSSPGQLRATMDKYEELAGKTMEEAIRSECSGTLKEGYLAIGKIDKEWEISCSGILAIGKIKEWEIGICFSLVN